MSEIKSGKSKASKVSKKSNKSKKTEEVNNNSSNEQNQQTTYTISARAYLEENVSPVVQEAMFECAKKRPPNPLEFVGNYILDRAHGK